MTPQQREAAWAAAIERAKGMVQVKSKNQMLIAELALSVCEISWGGTHMVGKYTLARFAKETGLHIKTLSHWVSVRRNVYDRLPITKAKKLSFTKLSHINAVAGPASTMVALTKAHDEVAEANVFDAKIKRQLADLRTLCTNFVQKNAALKCNKETLQEILFYTGSIDREIKKEHPGLKPKSHGIAALRLRNTSAARALDIPRHRGHKTAVVKTDAGEVRISPKDRDVALFIKKAATFVRPIDIAVKLRKNANHTAWVCRSIEKLMAAGMIERNAVGHYRWKLADTDAPVEVAAT